MILRENAVLVGAGLIAGSVAAVFAARTISSRLFGIAPTDAPTFVAAAGAMVLPALAAVLIPARRATHVDPAISLRHD